MKTPDPCRSLSADCATKHAAAGIEPLEARIAPATLAALPGNASFEDSADFVKWTISAGPGTTFVEYLAANVSTTVVRGAVAPEGDAYAHLEFSGTVANGTTGFGPSLQSETFTATAGEKILVTWRATNNGDVAHPRGRLFTAAGAPVGTFFDSDTGTTDFATSMVTVPAAGQYYLLFENGASDVTTGGLVGAKLDIDAVHRTPNGVTVSTLMNGQMSVDVSSEDPLSNEPNTFLITLDETGDYAEVFVNGSLDFIAPLAGIDQINVLGRGGNDQLTVDSSHGLIALAGRIHFDGGGATDTLSLIQSGNLTRTSDSFSVGPNAGEGTSTITGGMVSQTVSWTNVEPVLDNVPAASLTVSGTTAGNTISSVAGTGGGVFTGTTAKITVDSFSSVEFNNKTLLTIDALGGGDAITLNNPSAPAGLTGIAVVGGAPATSPGDTLHDAVAGAIQPSAAGAGTITSSGLPTVSFTGIEVASLTGFVSSAGIVTAAGDRASAGQDDTFVVTTNATSQFLSLALNGSVGLYALQAAITRIDADGLLGHNSLSLIGTSAAETLVFDPTAADAGHTSISGVVVVDYAAMETVVLNSQGGDDTIKIGGAVGTVKVIGGSASDRIDFSAAASRVVFDLDAVGTDQFVNSTGQVVNLGDVVENFTGSAFSDTLRVNAANFIRDLKGGANGSFPPGDELSFDGQQQVVKTTLVNASAGTYHTKGYADVTFSGFETPLIANSPSGPGFGTPTNSNAFDTAHVYNLLKSTSGGKVAPGKAPAAVATADLNGDGFIDMVTVNSSTANIGVLLNLGDGTFGTATSYKTKGVSPQDIAIGNFDANPGLDLAVTNRGSHTIAIFSGDGLGGFSTPTLLKTALYPSAIAVGDVNGDRIDDLVVTHPALNKISVLLGDNPGFAAPVTFKTGGTRPVDVVIGDFDADGKADVATANLYSNNVSFFKGDGLGGLAASTQFATGKRPTALAAADFNLDGKLDLAVSNQVSLFVSVLFGGGAAVAPADQFQQQLQVALPGIHAPTAIVATDFNDDGLVDLGLGNSAGTNFTILIGGNLGKFSQPYEFDLGKFRPGPKTGGIAVADLNNDGLLDVLTTGLYSADARVLLRKI